jgi:hypothetical protein
VEAAGRDLARMAKVVSTLQGKLDAAVDEARRADEERDRFESALLAATSGQKARNLGANLRATHACTHARCICEVSVARVAERLRVRVWRVCVR